MVVWSSSPDRARCACLPEFAGEFCDDCSGDAPFTVAPSGTCASAADVCSGVGDTDGLTRDPQLGSSGQTLRDGDVNGGDGSCACIWGGTMDPSCGVCAPGLIMVGEPVIDKVAAALEAGNFTMGAISSDVYRSDFWPAGMSTGSSCLPPLPVPDQPSSLAYYDIQDRIAYCVNGLPGRGFSASAAFESCRCLPGWQNADPEDTRTPCNQCLPDHLGPNCSPCPDGGCPYDQGRHLWPASRHCRHGHVCPARAGGPHRDV